MPGTVHLDMPSKGAPRPRLHVRALLLLVIALLCAPPLSARNPKLSKYPLRIHVMATDASYKSPRMGPGDGVSCDMIDDILSSLSFGTSVSVDGTGMDPCSFGPGVARNAGLDEDDVPVYSGEGRADLVSPPYTTQGLTFHYDDCSRIRMLPGFQSLPARWKKAGRKLEVLVNSDAIPVNGKPLPLQKCTFSVSLRDTVYLLLRNGNIVEVSQDVYRKKPALRVFLSGNAQPILPRPEQFTVPAHPVPAAQQR